MVGEATRSVKGEGDAVSDLRLDAQIDKRYAY
jgi:hypothetical protein